MVVQHNLQAMNATRMLGVTTGAQAKSTEKLSSGYRINRAADDAAGLSISEKMRKQIRGLDQASTNAQDGVSAVQTAEGALTEVHSMLQRMNELAVQASNGTNSETDRQSIQDEIDQLTTEIDRVAETTKFNETYLLKGDAAGTSSTVKVAAHDAGFNGKLVDLGDGKTKFELNKALADGDKISIAGKEYTIGTSGKGSVLDPSTLNTSTEGYAKKTGDTTFTTQAMNVGDSVSYDGNTYTLVDKIGIDDIKLAKDDTFVVGGITFTVTDSGESATINETAKTGTIDASKVNDYIKNALAEGKQVTSAKYTVKKKSTAGAAAATDVASTTKITIVSKLEKGEVSTVQTGGKQVQEVAAIGSGKVLTTEKFKAGDSVTLSGKTTVATDETPDSAKNVYSAIKALSATNTVTIGTGVDAVAYTIVDTEDEADESVFKATKETILSKIKDGMNVDVNGTAYTVIGDIGVKGTDESVITTKTAYALMAEELEKASSIGSDVAAKVKNNNDGTFSITQGSVEVANSLNFSLHVGADADATNKISIDIESMSAAGLGIKGIKVNGDDSSNATYAIDAIADAVIKVSAQRSALGAVQNRLEHTIDNLDNVVENTTSAESRIRDTDMAEEMLNYSKSNILAQAGQSMLAQANQATQGVLSLLQ